MQEKIKAGHKIQNLGSEYRIGVMGWASTSTL